MVRLAFAREALLDRQRDAVLSRHRPGHGESLLVHQNFDAKIGGMAEREPGLGRGAALNDRERLVESRLAACVAPAQIDVEVRRTLERAPEKGFGLGRTIRLHKKIGGEEHEARVGRAILERP